MDYDFYYCTRICQLGIPQRNSITSIGANEPEVVLKCIDAEIINKNSLLWNFPSILSRNDCDKIAVITAI